MLSDEVYDMSGISVELIDIYDTNRTVEVNWIRYSAPTVANVLVNCNGVSKACMYEVEESYGLPRVQYGAIQYLNNFTGFISWIGSGHLPFHFRYDNKANIVSARLGVPSTTEYSVY